MRGPHNIFRLIRTGATFQRAGALDIAMDAFGTPASMRAVIRFFAWPFQFLGYQGDPNLPPATRALTALGPAYVKFGQILSTRPDIVGRDMAQNLRILQDKLPPFGMDVARKAIEESLDIQLDDVFEGVSEPVAAASIAQVHRATLRKTGQTVAIKILRPNIKSAFRKDIDAFYFAARVIEFLLPASRRLRPLEVVKHFEDVVAGELDLRMESASAAEFAMNTQHDKNFSVPKINWDLSARNVMTMDWVDGVPAGDNAAIDAGGHDRRVLGENVLKLFLNHALRDGYFHADMHQGNLKIAPNGDIVAYDFGIMGRIDSYTRRVYAEILHGFIKQDYRRVAEAHFEAGYVPADQDIDAFAHALRTVGEPIFGMDASHISMGHLLNRLFEVTEAFGMETQTELLLLQRTMVVAEGVARSLHPQVNMWEISKPILEKYVRENIGPLALSRDLIKTLQILSRYAPKLPMLAESLIISQGGLSPRPKAKSALFVLAALIGVAVGFMAAYFL